MHQYERLLRISTLLIREPQSTVELADAFGVSQRTIFRDIALLRQMGMEVAYDPLEGVLRARNLEFRDLFDGQAEELIRLLICAYTSPLFHASRATLAEVEMSLLSFLPRAERDFLLGLRECVLTESAAHPGSNTVSAILSAVRQGTSVIVRWKEPGSGIPMSSYLRQIELHERNGQWGISADSSFHRRRHFFAFDHIQKMDELSDAEPCRTRTPLSTANSPARQAS